MSETKLTNIETLAADSAHVITEVDHYETDLISFLSAHKVLALQFAVIIGLPVAVAAYKIGQHFPINALLA